MTRAVCVCTRPGAGRGLERLPAQKFYSAPYSTAGPQPDRLGEPVGCIASEEHTQSMQRYRSNGKAGGIQRNRSGI